MAKRLPMSGLFAAAIVFITLAAHVAGQTPSTRSVGDVINGAVASPPLVAAPPPWWAGSCRQPDR